MNEPEQRTTRDGLQIFGVPTTRDGALAGPRTIRTDAFRRILEGIQRLEASLDRAAEQIESEKPTTEPRRRTLRERILGTNE